MKTRKKKILFMLIIGLLAGIAYTIFCRTTGLAIPCLFRTVTGCRCPGCGITTLFLELSKGHIDAAFQANPVVFVLLFPYSILFVRMLIRYWKGKDIHPGKIQTRCYYLTIIVLVCYGVIRNL